MDDVYNTMLQSNSGTIYFSYFCNSGELHYATNIGSSWNSGLLDVNELFFSGPLLVDSNDVIHTIYTERRKENLYYAYKTGNLWQNTLIASNISLTGTVMALDYNGKVHIVWRGKDEFGNYDRLRYVSNVSGTWITENVNDVGEFPYDISIAIDSHNSPHISYYESNANVLKYALLISGSWATTVLDNSADVGRGSSIAIDSNDKVHISYIDATNKKLMYINNVSGNWNDARETLADTQTKFSATVLVLDSSNYAHIAYRYSYTGLNYIENSSASWSTPQTVTYTSNWYFALDKNDKVHILFQSNDNLYYASNTADGWQNTYLGEFQNKININGYANRLSIDSHRKFHISCDDHVKWDVIHSEISLQQSLTAIMYLLLL
jgi:hypothetical protein